MLQDAGKVTAEIAKAHAETEFEKYRIVQDRLFESDFDRVIKRIESSGQMDIDEGYSEWSRRTRPVGATSGPYWLISTALA